MLFSIAQDSPRIVHIFFVGTVEKLPLLLLGARESSKVAFRLTWAKTEKPGAF